MQVSNEQLLKDEEKYPLGYGEPEDVANIAAFLVSDAAKWITGSTIIADGGFSIQ
jgi:NAD(P)-dependent dehydrogenase (short-subunit alcohol dehydrogenase family)